MYIIWNERNVNVKRISLIPESTRHYSFLWWWSHHHKSVRVRASKEFLLSSTFFLIVRFIWMVVSNLFLCSNFLVFSVDWFDWLMTRSEWKNKNSSRKKIRRKKRFCNWCLIYLSATIMKKRRRKTSCKLMLNVNSSNILVVHLMPNKQSMIMMNMNMCCLFFFLLLLLFFSN